MNQDSADELADRHKIAELVRSACFETALEAYEDAGISGLCAAGRWEYPLPAISTLDLEAVLSQAVKGPPACADKA